MSVRRRYWLNDKTGEQKCAWIVDVQATGLDGVSRRVVRVSPIQSRRHAEKLEHRLRVELVECDGHDVAKVVPLYREHAQRFLTYARTNNRPSEAASKESILRVHLLPEFGERRLDQIGAADVEAFKATKLAAGLAPSTIVNHLTVLRKSLAVAREWGLIQSVPAIRWLRRPLPDIDFLTPDEADRLIQGAHGCERELIVVAVRTGLRQGELRALRWSDVDLDRRRLVVRCSAWKKVVGPPKNGRARQVPLCEQAHAALAHCPRRAELVFPGRSGGILTSGEMKGPLRRATHRAELRRIGWHCLRHSFASHLVMRGAPLKAVQELLGHATIDMTMRYAHLTPELRSDVVRLLDSADQSSEGRTEAAAVPFQVS